MITSRSCVAKSTTASEDVQSRGLLDPDDVEADEQDDHDRAADDVPRVVLQRLPEDRQVVRDEERRDRDRDHVVQELRPRGAEADELVERVAREARGAAGLRVADGSFHVGQGRGREDQARDHEDERGQAEREGGRDSERVVDRRADVAVRRRKERGRAENALEPLLPPAAALGGSRSDRFGFGRAHGGRLSLRPAMGTSEQAPAKYDHLALPDLERRPFAAGAGLGPAGGKPRRGDVGPAPRSDGS